MCRICEGQYDTDGESGESEIAIPQYRLSPRTSHLDIETYGAFIKLDIKLLAALDLQDNRAECHRALAAVCDVLRLGNSTIVEAVLWSISATMAHDRAQHYFSEEIPDLTAGLSGGQIDIHRAV